SFSKVRQPALPGILRSRSFLRPWVSGSASQFTPTRAIRGRSSSSFSPHKSWSRPSSAILAAAAIVGYFYSTSHAQVVHAEAANEPPDVKIEQSKKRKGASKEENRDLLSSQHLQVKRSWENPGVYAWGSNTGKVVAPDSNEIYVKKPRRITYFDDVLLRDLKLD